MRRLLFFSLLVSACLSDPIPGNDPDCDDCRADGETCAFTINCRPGSICNLVSDELYDSDKPGSVCFPVVCASDTDCEGSKVCTLEQLCRTPICQGNAECDTGEVCIRGECAPRPTAAGVVRCAVATPHQALPIGGVADLHAVAIDVRGQVVPLAEFDWTSSAPDVATIAGSAAIAGTRPGAATLTASVREAPNITCGGLVVRTFDALPDGTLRVVVADGRSGAPVDGAQVTIVAGATLTGTTDADGAVVLAAEEAPSSVTIVRPGSRSVTVLAPGTRDLFVTTTRAQTFTRAGGIRGSVDVSKDRLGDMQAAIVYSARPLDLFEYRALPAVDIVKTELKAPQLGIDTTSDLPGNFVVGLGSTQATRDSTRCRGTETGLGCFLTRAPEGRTAAWVLGGQYKLSQITAVDFTVQEAERYSGKDRTRLIRAFSSLIRGGWLGAHPYLEIEAAPLVATVAGVDCTNPANAISADCRADFDAYQDVEMSLTKPAQITTKLVVPSLPDLPTAGCASAMVASTYAVLPGRGLVLLGMGSADDTATDADVPNCSVEGDESPFGEQSFPLAEGEIGLSSAPSHSGLEGSDRIVVLSAMDTSEDETRPFDLNVVTHPVDHLGPLEDLTARPFLAYPQGTMTRGLATLETTVSERASGVRLVIETARGSWVVYAPRSMSTIALPDVAAVRAVLADAAFGTLQAFEADSGYEALWSLSAAGRIDDAVTTLRAIATTQCSTDGPCAFRP